MKIFKWENGQIRLAIFAAFILSAAFSYMLFFKQKVASPDDLKPIIENQRFILDNQAAVFRGWKQSISNPPIDTVDLFVKYQKRKEEIDSILLAMEKK